MLHQSRTQTHAHAHAHTDTRNHTHARTHALTSRSIGTERHRLSHQPDEHRVARVDHLLAQVRARVEREKFLVGQGARPVLDHPSDRGAVVHARSHPCNGRERGRGGWGA